MTNSRPKRWAEAVAKMRDGLSDLQDLKQEYEDWFEGMPENLQNGPTGEKLQAIADLDLDSLEGEIEECDSVELPQGFGRD